MTVESRESLQGYNTGCQLLKKKSELSKSKNEIEMKAKRGTQECESGPKRGRAHAVDMRSDTVTKPTEKMREAMCVAEVGDDVFGDDPTIIKLQETAAKIFNKEAALYVPSGTMGNLISTMVHCELRGSEVSERFFFLSK